VSKIVLDTDIGTDVDDVCALGLALCSPELDIVAVTTVFDNVVVRSRMAASLLRIAGRSDIPIGIGSSHTLLRNRPLHWAGWEGEGLVGPEDADTTPWVGTAGDLIIDLVRANPGEITLVSVGPLTNIAEVVLREPNLPKLVRGLVMMGGLIRIGDTLDNPWAEWNVRVDPEASSVVFGSGIPITMVGLDVTKRVKIDRTGLDPLHASASLLGRTVGAQLAMHMDHHTHRKYAYLHDPLAVGMAIDPTFCQTVPMSVRVETRGELTAGLTLVERPTKDKPATADVCVDVDGPRFEEFFVRRIADFGRA
jgi:purine nucleosidase